MAIYEVIRDPARFFEVCKTLNFDNLLFADTETCVDEGRSDGGLYGQVRLLQLYQEDWERAILIDCFFVPLLDVLPMIQPAKMVFHGGCYDLHTINIKTDEVWLPKTVDDTLYASRLFFYTRQKFGFYECLDWAGVSDENIRGIDKKAAQKSDWSKALSDKQLEYATYDVTYLSKLYRVVESVVDSQVYRLDIQSLYGAISYARNGMPINQETVKAHKKHYITKLEEVGRVLPINPRSSKQACEYLGCSKSDKMTLANMVLDGNLLAKDVLDSRHYSKSLEYLNAYDRPVIKGFFQPSSAVSGRFSCSGGSSFGHVNLQQMPGALHDIVEAPEGKVIIYKDYSGVELRMAVAYTGEPVMAALMKSGEDMHTATAKYIFNSENITELQRTIAKNFNFSLIYGAGVKTVQANLKFRAGITMSLREVAKLKDSWFNLYEGFAEWHKMHKDHMSIYGYVDVSTALGRTVRAYQLTDSLNIPIQGSSAEVQKVALGMLFSKYPDAYLINTIHDSNILLQDVEEADMWGERLDECMVAAWDYVIQDLADPDIKMPHGFEKGPIWTFH